MEEFEDPISFISGVIRNYNDCINGRGLGNLCIDGSDTYNACESGDDWPSPIK